MGQDPEHVGPFGVSMGTYEVNSETWTSVVVTQGVKDDGSPNIVTAHAFRSGKAAGDATRVVLDVLASLAWPTE